MKSLSEQYCLSLGYIAKEVCPNGVYVSLGYVSGESLFRVFRRIYLCPGYVEDRIVFRGRQEVFPQRDFYWWYLEDPFIGYLGEEISNWEAFSGKGLPLWVTWIG